MTLPDGPFGKTLAAVSTRADDAVAEEHSKSSRGRFPTHASTPARSSSSGMPDRRPITATYRLQLHAGFGFADAAERRAVPGRLGVSHLYLSPILQAAPGSMHGYDVVDHSRVSADLGGEGGARRAGRPGHEHGLGIVVDVVPNHMAIPTPRAPQPAALGDAARSAATRRRALVRRRLGARATAGSACRSSARRSTTCSRPGRARAWRARRRAGAPLRRPVFPLAPGSDATATSRGARRSSTTCSASWRDKDGRAQLPPVLRRRHADRDPRRAARRLRRDPRRAARPAPRAASSTASASTTPTGSPTREGYLERLRDATDGAWVVVEKILAATSVSRRTGRPPGPRATTRCAPSRPRSRRRTGRSSTSAGGDRRRQRALARATEHRGQGAGGRRPLPARGPAARAPAVDERRRARARAARTATPSLGCRELLAARRGLPRLPAPRPASRATSAGRGSQRWRGGWPGTARPRRGRATLLTDLLVDTDERGRVARDLVVRFQQVCGPVMAKGVEDTTFYRWHRLIALNEVGRRPRRARRRPTGAPARVGRSTRRALPAGHDDALDARHQAQRGRAGPPARRCRGHRRLGRMLGGGASARGRVRRRRADGLPALQTLLGAWPIEPRPARATT